MAVRAFSPLRTLSWLKNKVLFTTNPAPPVDCAAVVGLVLNRLRCRLPLDLPYLLQFIHAGTSIQTEIHLPRLHVEPVYLLPEHYVHTRSLVKLHQQVQDRLLGLLSNHWPLTILSASVVLAGTALSCACLRKSLIAHRGSIPSIQSRNSRNRSRLNRCPLAMKYIGLM